MPQFIVQLNACQSLYGPWYISKDIFTKIRFFSFPIYLYIVVRGKFSLSLNMKNKYQHRAIFCSIGICSLIYADAKYVHSSLSLTLKKRLHLRALPNRYKVILSHIIGKAILKVLEKQKQKQNSKPLKENSAAIREGCIFALLTPNVLCGLKFLH